MKQSKILPLTFLMLGPVLLLTVSANAVSSKPAPDFNLVTLEGKMITKASLPGKPALLMFWASWCQTCQKELPNLKTLYEQKKIKGLQAVAIGFQDEESNIKDYVQAHEAIFIFPTAYDVKDQVSTVFGAKWTPTFILLDAQGMIALIHVGGGFLQNPNFQKFIQNL
ncbi:MAG: TlpA family protein disulfide reductase [Nitrososphaera sp.]|nr:TlpA family protein disulfide reductase [Nitrososphaera sp.]